MIPMGFLLASASIVGRRLMQKWDIRQEAFSKLSDFSQESFSGIAVIKAFVKEGRELWNFKKLNVII
jgi:ATP-binding cassette subfamily B protein